LVAYAVGVCGYVIGLALSAVLDLPSGALIVWTLAGCGIAARLAFAPHKLPTERLDGVATHGNGRVTR
jgi:zinc/manganese transport system permease protein